MYKKLSFANVLKVKTITKIKSFSYYSFYTEKKKVIDEEKKKKVELVSSEFKKKTTSLYKSYEKKTKSDKKKIKLLEDEILKIVGQVTYAKINNEITETEHNEIMDMLKQ